MDRREFMKGAALGVGAGVLGSMGLYSYSPLRRAFLPEVKRGTADIGGCKSVKVTNISETSWFDNGNFMNDVTGAGGLLVDQYPFNRAPFGNGKGVGKGTFEEGLKRIKHLLPHKIDEAWAIAKENCVHADNAGGYSCLVEIESMEGETTRYLFDTGWNYDWMDTCFKREGIDAVAIHGDKSQHARQAALTAFKTGECKVLVATDIAARGIDIAGLSHVINYDMPMEPEAYVHRIGRTGRAGRDGTAISFCCIDEVKQLGQVEKLIGKRLPLKESEWPMEITTPSEPKPRQPRPDTGKGIADQNTQQAAGNPQHQHLSIEQHVGGGGGEIKAHGPHAHGPGHRPRGQRGDHAG